jgi:hemerythrin-like domain-containing protein
MKPMAPLAREHDLIKKAVGLLEASMEHILETGKGDLVVEDALLDFFAIYAERLHHGKEEGILFKNLNMKPITAEHRATMEKLLDDHREQHELLLGLEEEVRRYAAGRRESLGEVISFHRGLARLYRMHMSIEDRQFFVPVMDYFTQHEQQEMLDAVRTFDANIVHGIYGERVRHMLQRARQRLPAGGKL